MGFIGQVAGGLRFRLLLLILLACAPLVALILHTAGEDRRRAMANWSQRSQRMLSIARDEEQQAIGGTRQLLLAVAESSSIRTLRPHRCKEYLDMLFGSYPRYANLGVLTTNGELIASAVPVSGARDRSDARFFQRALETRAFAVGDFPAKPGNGKPTLAFGYPVLGHAGVVLAVVFAELDLDWVDRFGSELPGQLVNGATWTDLDRKGRILEKYPDPQNAIGSSYSDPALLPTFFDQPKGVLEARERNGQKIFYAFATMPSRLAGGPVATVLAIPTRILFAEADRMLQRNMTWLGIAAGLALALGWIGSKLLILRPVRALVRSAAQLAAGELSVRTGLSYSRGEIGQLTRAFDRMAEALEQREYERERTAEKLQVLSHRLVEVQEAERRQIARELHDEIGQSLTAAEMNLQAALRFRGPAALERRLEDSIQAVERVLEQVHDLSLNLRPSMLDDLGLEPALRWYTQRQGSLTGLATEFHAEPLDGRLHSVVETECFRVAQEALTNVVRHSQARSVRVALSRSDGHLHLSVRDDGVGFDPAASRSNAVSGASLGLLSMEERATLAGGGLEFNSEPGRGTEVHAWFPLRYAETEPYSKP